MSWIFRRTLFPASLAAALVASGAIAFPVAAQPTLYVHDATNLYSVDPSTAGLTLIGPVGFALGSLDEHPTTGEFWGIGFRNVSPFNLALVRVDPVTGNATSVVDTTASPKELAFRSDGVLFASKIGQLDTVDLTLGTQTLVGLTSLGYGGVGMGFDASDTLRLDQYSSLYQVNQTTGAVSSPLALNGTGWSLLCAARLEAIDLDASTGDYYAIAREGEGFGNQGYFGCGGGTTADHLVRIDATTGDVTLIGSLGIFSNSLVAVPEPGVVVALGSGICLLGGLAGRRRS